MSDILLPGDAGFSDVLAGRVFSSKSGYMAVGTMPNNGAPTYMPGPNVQSLPAGYISGGSVQGVNFNPAKVLNDTTIAGTAGTMPNNGTPVFTPSASQQNWGAGYVGSITVQGVSVPAQNVLSGTTIAGVAGTMPNQTAGGVVPQGTAKWGNGDLAVYPQQGYYKGGAGAGEIRVTVAQLQAAEGALTPGAIIQGQSIYGVAGNVVPKVYAKISPALFVSSGSGSSSVSASISGLGFVPSIIIAAFQGSYANGANYGSNADGVMIWSADGTTYLSKQYFNASILTGTNTVPGEARIWMNITNVVNGGFNISFNNEGYQVTCRSASCTLLIFQ